MSPYNQPAEAPSPPLPQRLPVWKAHHFPLAGGYLSENRPSTIFSERARDLLNFGITHLRAFCQFRHGSAILCGERIVIVDRSGGGHPVAAASDPVHGEPGTWVQLRNPPQLIAINWSM